MPEHQPDWPASTSPTLMTVGDVARRLPAIDSPYLTAVEAAAYVRSTVQGIYSLVKRGRIKPMPGSGKLLFTRDELDRCLASRSKR